MKINYTNRMQPVNPYKVQLDKTQMQNDIKTTKAKDRVDISSAAKQMQGENPISAARADKVEALRKQVESGEYKVNPQATAEKFLAYWQGIGSVKKTDE